MQSPEDILINLNIFLNEKSNFSSILNKTFVNLKICCPSLISLINNGGVEFIINKLKIINNNKNIINSVSELLNRPDIKIDEANSLYKKSIYFYGALNSVIKCLQRNSLGGYFPSYEVSQFSLNIFFKKKKSISIDQYLTHTKLTMSHYESNRTHSSQRDTKFTVNLTILPLPPLKQFPYKVYTNLEKNKDKKKTQKLWVSNRVKKKIAEF